MCKQLNKFHFVVFAEFELFFPLLCAATTTFGDLIILNGGKTQFGRVAVFLSSLTVVL